MRLSENFTLEELTVSATALKHGIINAPDLNVITNLSALANKILQPIRNRWGKPIHISSGYRCHALNKIVGGVLTSQHLLGEAADINIGRKNNAALFHLIKKMIQNEEIIVGQLIDENQGSWIHVSLPNKKWHNNIISINS